MPLPAPRRWREVMAEGRGPLTLGIVLIELVTAVPSLASGLADAFGIALAGGLVAVMVTGPVTG